MPYSIVGAHDVWDLLLGSYLKKNYQSKNCDGVFPPEIQNSVSGGDGRGWWGLLGTHLTLSTVILNFRVHKLVSPKQKKTWRLPTDREFIVLPCV